MKSFAKFLWRIVVILCLAGGTVVPVTAQADSPKPRKSADRKTEHIVPLNKAGTVLLDAKGKRVLLKAKVTLREGLLEMLLCRKGTKEHESILAVDAKAYVIHTGLLALGVKAGTPVRFDPQYEPPKGQKIDIFLQWSDKKGHPQRVPAQSWVRHVTRRFYGQPLARLPKGLEIPQESELRWDERNRELSWFGRMAASERDALLKLSDDAKYQAAIHAFYKRSQPRQMNADFVFVGSGFFIHEQTGEKYYQAEGGDVICVANFPTAMIDIAMKSSASGEANLLFEPYTERIPPLSTDVTVELVPVFPAKSKGGKAQK